MTKAQLNDKELEIIKEMKETVAKIRDREINQDCFYPSQRILDNMNNWFGGMAYVMEHLTGKEYHWGNNNEDGYYVVVIGDGKEVKYPV